MKDNIIKVDTGNLQGGGTRNPRQDGTGLNTICKCPECGYEAKKELGKPCNEKKCPKCGATMRQESKQSKRKEIHEIIIPTRVIETTKTKI